MNNLNVCLFPSEIIWGEKEQNIRNIEEKFSSIHPQTDLVIIPETFSTGFPAGQDKEDVRILAERNTGETIERIKKLSTKYNMAVIGSFIADSGGLLYNRAFFIEPSGEEYFEDKRHLFPLGGENKIFRNGTKRLQVRFRGWNIAIIVCYDLRFPVWCKNRDNEYDMLVAVANWPKARVEVWDLLLRARAVENEAFVCGVNCRGIDKENHEYNGHTAVYDYKGRDIKVDIPDQNLCYASLSLNKLQYFREKNPFWKDSDPFTLT